MAEECVQNFSCLNIESNVTVNAEGPIECQVPSFIIFFFFLQMCAEFAKNNTNPIITTHTNPTVGTDVMNCVCCPR